MKKQNRELLQDILRWLFISFIIAILITSIICSIPINDVMLGTILNIIIPSFTGLVAFLGAVIVFMLDNNRDQLKDIAIEIEGGNPQGIWGQHRRIISASNGLIMSDQRYLDEWGKYKLTDSSWVENRKEQLTAIHKLYVQEWQARNKLMVFVSLSFINVGAALLGLMLRDRIGDDFRTIFVWGLVALSIIILIIGWHTVRWSIGFAIDLH